MEHWNDGFEGKSIFYTYKNLMKAISKPVLIEGGSTYFVAQHSIIPLFLCVGMRI